MRNRRSQGRTKSRQRLGCVELAPAFVPPAAPKAPASWTHSRRFAGHDAGRQPQRAGKPELILERALSLPVLLSMLGRPLLRRHIRRQLETKAEAAMTDLLSRYRRRLREWFRESIVELRDSFAGRAGVYRAQLEERGSRAGIVGTRTDLEADSGALQNWPTA